MRTKRKLSAEDTLTKDEVIDDLFSEVCAICDDGGNLLCCEGGCLRSFHATEEAGWGSLCKSLGFLPDDIAGIQKFYCKNCKHKQHQCFACGKLGSSDNSSGAAEVFPCHSANCGRFYHRNCVAILLCPDDTLADDLEKRIAGGELFTCPLHKCCICKQEEIKKDRKLQFAVCMRCPKSYHRRCLPREIAFKNKGGIHLGGNAITRAWEGVLPNRVLIYCTKHELDISTGSARMDHIKFPDVEQSRLPKKSIIERKWKPLSEFLVDGERVVSNKRNISLDKSYTAINGSTVFKTQKPSSKKTRKRTSEPCLDLKKAVHKKRDPTLIELLNQSSTANGGTQINIPDDGQRCITSNHEPGSPGSGNDIGTFSSTFYSCRGTVSESSWFAPGPNMRYALKNSAGWLDE